MHYRDFVCEQIRPGARLRGLDLAGIVEAVQVAKFGSDALRVREH
jgi:hypothetical protein